MISICIIVKNEEENIKKCLDKLSKLEYEIIVVDTGSTDNTKNIVRQYTDKVYDFTWCDDFSAARNFAIEKANQEYVLMVDSDEFLVDFHKKDFETLLLQHPKEVGRIHRNNIFTRNGMDYTSKELVNRVFPKKYYRYTGKIHEQIVALKSEEYVTYEVPLFFDHIGYNGEEKDRKNKAQRNIQLLLRSLREDGEDPYTLYQLGKGYYFQEDYKEAADYFGRALMYDLNTKLEYVIDMVEMYGYSLINSNQLEHALLMENIYEEFSHSADFVYMMGFIYMNCGMFKEAIREFASASKYKSCKVIGVNSYLSFYNLGVIYECIGDKEKAVYYYKQCGSYEPAQIGMNRVKS